jgi:hypothetical protein
MVREYTYQVDLDGTLWHDGTAIADATFYGLVHRSLKHTDDGRLQARCQGEICWIEAADTPFVVESIETTGSDQDPGAPKGVELTLTGGVREPLDPKTVRVGADNVMYARVRRGDFSARLSRKAYYQLAEHVEAEGDGFVLVLSTGRYPIAGASTR